VNTPLYPIVEQHLPTLRDELQRHEVPLPRFVLTEFQDYLRCGRLEYGFVRVKCNGMGCAHAGLRRFCVNRSISHPRDRNTAIDAACSMPK